MWSYNRRRHLDAIRDAPALVVHELVAAYPGRRRLALNHISLSVAVGERVALLGHNGAGKSTLLKVIAGLLPARSGTILIYGHPSGVCHHRVAYLPQRGEIDWRFPITLRKLVLSGRYVHLGWFRRPGTADWRIADAMIERLGLSALRDRQIGQLSGGQQQRAMLARALAQDADLLLLDEPFNAIDANTRAVMLDVLAGLRTQGKTVITATHEVTHLSSTFDTVLSLAEGRHSNGETDYDSAEDADNE